MQSTWQTLLLPWDITAWKKEDKYVTLHILNTATANAQWWQQSDASQALAAFAQPSSRGEKLQQRGWTHTAENDSLRVVKIQNTGHNQTDTPEPTTAWTGARSAALCSASPTQHKCSQHNASQCWGLSPHKINNLHWSLKINLHPAGGCE